MKTFKQFITENITPIDDHKSWESYTNNTDFNPHVGEDDATRSTESVHDLRMRKLASAHSGISVENKPVIRRFLDSPYNVISHIKRAFSHKIPPDTQHAGQNLDKLHKALQSHNLNTEATVHVGLSDVVPSGKSMPVDTHHIGSTDPQSAFENSDPQDKIHHILRVDLAKGKKYALVGNTKDKSGTPVSNQTFKNAVVIPQGGRFTPAGQTEHYKDKEGNIIHVHPVYHR